MKRTTSGMGQPLAKVEVCVKGACARSSRFSSSQPVLHRDLQLQLRVHLRVKKYLRIKPHIYIMYMMQRQMYSCYSNLFAARLRFGGGSPRTHARSPWDFFAKIRGSGKARVWVQGRFFAACDMLFT